MGAGSQCRDFIYFVDIEELPDSTDDNVRAVVPVLLFNGNLDVATPL